MLTEEEKDPARGEEESRDPQAPAVAPVAFGDTTRRAQPHSFPHPSNLSPSSLPAPLTPFFFSCFSSRRSL